MTFKRVAIWLILLIAAGIALFFGLRGVSASNNCLSVTPGGNFNATSTWTTCGGTIPATGDSITIASGAPVTLVANTQVAGVTINGSGILHGGAFLLTDTGNFTDNGTYDGTKGLTLSGTSAVIDGKGYITNTATTTISGASGPSFAATASTTITGVLSITTAASVTAGGVVTEASTTLITGAITFTNNGTFNQNGVGGIVGSVSGSTWVNASNSTLNFAGGTTTLLATGTLTATANSNTVNYDLAGAQTLKAVTYQNLTFGATGTKTATGVTTVSGNFLATAGTSTVLFATVGGSFTVSGGAITTGANMVVTATTTLTTGSITQGTFTYGNGGNLVVSGGTLTTGAAAFNVSGTALVSAGILTTTGAAAFTIASTTEVSGGTLTLPASNGNKTFTGLVKVDGGTLSGANVNVIFLGGLTQTSGSVSLTGTAYFNTTQALNGTIAITTMTASSSAMVTNNGTLTVTTFLASSTADFDNEGTSTLGTMTIATGTLFTNNGTLLGTTFTVATGSVLTNNGIVNASGTFTVTGVVTNNATTTAASTLNGLGSWTQGSNSTLNVAGATGAAMGVAVVDFHTNPNTVNYTGGNQTLATTTYQNLIFSVAGTKTAPLVTTVLGNFTASTGTATVAFTSVGGAFTVSGGAITTSGNLTVTATTTLSLGSLTQGSVTYSESGNFLVTGGTFTSGAAALTINGTTEIRGGTFTMPTGNGNKTFTSLVTVDGGTLSGATANAIFLAGLTQTSGTVSITGTANFLTNAQALNGILAITTVSATSSATITNNGTLTATTVTASTTADIINAGTLDATTLTIATASTLTNNGSLNATTTFTVTGIVTNNATATAAGTLSGLGSWIQGSGATLNAFGATTNAFGVTTINAHSNPNTVNYNGAAQTCATTQYYNLSFAGTTTKTCTPTSPILNTLVMGGTTASWTMSTALTVSSTLTVSGGTLITGAVAFTVNSSTEISGGTLTLTNNTGNKTFNGLITLDGGTLNGAATSIIFSAGILNNAGTVSISGSSTILGSGVTFDGNNLINIAAIIVSSTDSVINNGTVNVSTTVSGNGSWTQGSSSILTLPLVSTSILPVSSFDAHTYPNTVNYDGAGNQTCLVAQYNSLTFGGSGTKTCNITSAVLGDLTYGGAGTWTLGAALTVDGNFTISAGTVDASSTHNFAVTLSGNFTNNGIFNTEANTVTLNGTSTQTLSGTMTGASDFNNLTITNNSGAHPSDCSVGGFTPSVAFMNSASVANTYTITTGGVGVEYDDASTYTFANTNWVGPPSQPIYFRDNGAGTFSFDVTGTQTPLAYINVSQSDASGGSTINAASITNIDCGSNINWSFGAVYGSPIDYTQAAYRLFGNQNSTQIGPTLAGLNASATLAVTGEAFRIRMLLAVDASTSYAGADSFTLQFADKGNGADCSVPQFPYTDITNSTTIAYNTNALANDGDLLTSTSTDPSDDGRAYIEETYQSASPFNVTTTIPAGEDGNWDFSLIDNGAPSGTDYCFQAAFANDAPLYAYSVYPEIITEGISISFPNVSGVQLNNGNPDITLLPATTNGITVTASTSDPGGPGNISFATSTIYRTSLGPNCTANNLNCYQIPSSGCTFTGTSSTVSCSAALWYYAQSTGNGSSSFPSDSWTGAITVTDVSGRSMTVTSSIANVDMLTAISLSTTTINYGIVLPNANTGSQDQIITIQSAGNATATIQLDGTALISGANTIATSSQHYATSSFTFGISDQMLTGIATPVSGILFSPPTGVNSPTSTLYWGLSVPIGVPSGTYTGNVALIAS